jgi:hypothetical protein
MLGGPPMKPKAPKAAPAAPIADEDFFSALAPAIGGASGLLGGAPTLGGGGAPPPPPSALSSAPPPPSAAAEQQRAVGGPRARPVPAKPGAIAPPPGAGGAPAAGAGPGSTALYMRGVSAMESGEWAGAADAFTAVLAALQGEPEGEAKAKKRQFAAQYLAAVLLLRAAATDTGPRGAKLYRWGLLTVLPA